MCVPAWVQVCMCGCVHMCMSVCMEVRGRCGCLPWFSELHFLRQSPALTGAPHPEAGCPIDFRDPGIYLPWFPPSPVLGLHMGIIIPASGWALGIQAHIVVLVTAGNLSTKSSSKPQTCIFIQGKVGLIYVVQVLCQSILFILIYKRYLYIISCVSVICGL